MGPISGPLSGKVAIVTGGSRGIGAEIVKQFAQRGCSHIATTYVANKAKAGEVLTAARKFNADIKTCAIQADLNDVDFGIKVVKEALAQLNTDHVDIMVSNAALIEMDTHAPVKDLTSDQFKTNVMGNAWAPLSLSKAVIGHMPPGGRIIMISSASSKLAVGDPTIAYAAAKAALDAVSRNLAAAWSVQYGITVNSISVGPTDTEANQAAMKGFPEDLKKLITEVAMLKRIGTVEEVANIVSFVASPEATWLTGNQIPANGGGLSLLQS